MIELPRRDSLFQRFPNGSIAFAGLQIATKSRERVVAERIRISRDRRRLTRSDARGSVAIVFREMPDASVSRIIVHYGARAPIATSLPSLTIWRRNPRRKSEGTDARFPPGIYSFVKRCFYIHFTAGPSSDYNNWY